MGEEVAPGRGSTSGITPTSHNGMLRTFVEELEARGRESTSRGCVLVVDVDQVAAFLRAVIDHQATHVPPSPRSSPPNGWEMIDLRMGWTEPTPSKKL